MNNQTPGSVGIILTQSAHTHLPNEATIPPIGRNTARFLSMIPAHLRAAGGRGDGAGAVPAAAARTPAGSAQADELPALLPEMVQQARELLARQARENRTQRRAANRARFRELLDAPTDQAAPDFRAPASLQEARQDPLGSVRVHKPQPVSSGPAWGELSAEAVLRLYPHLSQGARKVLQVLHAVGVAAGQERGYRVIPTSVAFHLPQVLLAPVVGYTTRHLRRLVAELEEAGAVDAGGHAANVTTRAGERRRMWDGSLWCVKLLPTNTRAYLTPEDWGHEWRDFDGDLKRGHTAQKAMSYLKTSEEKRWNLHLLQQWAVNPSQRFNPLSLDRTFDERQRESVQDVVYSLPLLADLSGPRQAEAIGRAASEIAHHFHDQHSRRYWCALLWAAVKNGTLEALAAQIQRLLVDVQEWPDLRNPGALLAARLRPTG